MLRTEIIHPDLLAALARAGHGAQVLIADGNYPHSTGVPATAERIHLNLAPGMLTVSQVLTPLAATVPIEFAEIMLTSEGEEAPIVAEYRALLPGVPFAGCERFEFYDRARTSDVAVVIATGEQRQYANLLLTIGVRTP
ncbi:RbsD/FucU family protein [Brevibacterium salitolerans]|uniref:RbsD/FucU domain-containing protein n=1 Tax=Brevibacterium salitolerans TaxID=1403566 RepID=A0ABN2WLE6_9MICO